MEDIHCCTAHYIDHMDSAAYGEGFVEKAVVAALDVLKVVEVGGTGSAIHL